MPSHTMLSSFLFHDVIGRRRIRLKGRHFRDRRLARAAGKVARLAAHRREAVAVLQFQRQLLVTALEVVVGANDALHQVMAHHVAFVEVAEANALDIAQDVR